MPAFERNFSALVGPALDEIKNSRPSDDEIILAINDRSLRDRDPRMQKWLRLYGVLHGLSQDAIAPIAAVIVKFADQSERLAPGCGYAAILQQFEKLYGLCSERAPKNKNGHDRDLTSLTSKALWVCYPNVVPICDNYAERALQVISRLMPLNLREAEAQQSQAAKRYAPFLDIWLQLYEELAPVIRGAAANYPYDVRVLDKMLWLIGRPGYGAEKGAQSEQTSSLRTSNCKAASA